jgi:hypothetical protein
MQAPKKAIPIKDALRAKMELDSAAHAPAPIDSAAVKQGRKGANSSPENSSAGANLLPASSYRTLLLAHIPARTAAGAIDSRAWRLRQITPHSRVGAENHYESTVRKAAPGIEIFGAPI